jgi:AraC family transcriptional regulator, regulatory protein of adaptative response / DNA-3-methyladenine glycosylase II
VTVTIIPLGARIPLGAGPPARDANTIRTRLTLPASFNFDWIRAFLTLRRVSSLERWTDDDVYIRSVCIDGASALLTIRYVTAGSRTNGARRETTETTDSWLDVSFTPAPRLTREAVRAAVSRMFDLDGDLETFIAHVRRDPLLGPLVRRRPHVRLPRLIDPFEGLVRAMLGQQVTVRAASTMTDRFTRQFGTVIGTGTVAARPRRRSASTGTGAAATGPSLVRPDVTPAGRQSAVSDASDAPDALYAFPRPYMISAAGADALRAIGLTRAKASAIARLAETLASGQLDCGRLADLPSDDVQAALVALPGIGPWTASYVRMRVLGDRDAFPAADLGVIKALEALGVPRAAQVATAERWRPWRAYGVLHLWESLSD